VHLLGHSLGAVAGRAWIKLWGGAPLVRHFVSLGGPHGGTALFRAVRPPLRDVLDPDGAWVARLNDGPEPVPTTVIRASWDQQVLPPRRAAIPGAREIVLQDHGHNSLLWSPEAHREILAALSSGDSQRPPSS